MRFLLRILAILVFQFDDIGCFFIVIGHVFLGNILDTFELSLSPHMVDDHADENGTDNSQNNSDGDGNHLIFFDFFLFFGVFIIFFSCTFSGSFDIIFSEVGVIFLGSDFFHDEDFVIGSEDFVSKVKSVLISSFFYFFRKGDQLVVHFSGLVSFGLETGFTSGDNKLELRGSSVSFLLLQSSSSVGSFNESDNSDSGEINSQEGGDSVDEIGLSGIIAVEFVDSHFDSEVDLHGVELGNFDLASGHVGDYEVDVLFIIEVVVGSAHSFVTFQVCRLVEGEAFHNFSVNGNFKGKRVEVVVLHDDVSVLFSGGGSVFQFVK